MKATHNVKAYRNSMDSTSGKAPFLGTYISHENVPIGPLCEQVAAQSGLAAIQVRAMLEGSFDAIAELEKDGLVVVHLDGMSVWAVITGSFPTGDAAFDPARNALNLAIRLDDTIRLALVNETAQMVTDADLTKVKLDNVKDIEVERPVNLIHGRHVFRAAGWNLVLDDAGARVYLKGKGGVEHEVTVDEVHSRQLFTAHTAELLEGGDYTLWVESRGGDAEGPLQKDGCKVKYLRVEDPPTGITLTGVHAPGIESPMIGQDSVICFDGTGLDAWDGETDKVEVKNNRAEEAEWSSVGEITIEYDDGMLKLSEGVWGTLADLSISTPGSEPRFRVTIGGSSAEIVATVAEP